MLYEQPEDEIAAPTHQDKITESAVPHKGFLRLWMTLLLVGSPHILPLIPMALVEPLYFAPSPGQRGNIKHSPASSWARQHFSNIIWAQSNVIALHLQQIFAECGNAPGVNSMVLLQGLLMGSVFPGNNYLKEREQEPPLHFASRMSTENKPQVAQARQTQQGLCSIPGRGQIALVEIT